MNQVTIAGGNTINLNFPCEKKESIPSFIPCIIKMIKEDNAALVELATDIADCATDYVCKQLNLDTYKTGKEEEYTSTAQEHFNAIYDKIFKFLTN